MVKIIVALLLLASGSMASGQTVTYPYYYRVYFKDKGDYNPASYSLAELFSARAVERREKDGITNPDFRDLPVNSEYLKQIGSLGLKLHCSSRWINSALFKSSSPFNTSSLAALPFVAGVTVVKKPAAKGSRNDKLDFSVTYAELPPFDRPLTMVNGYTLLNSGFNGKDILVAVLDGGFENGDKISSLNQLRSRNGIIITRNFVDNNNNVYLSSNHGTAVLSILAGNIDGEIEGTAQGADFLLLRTEDVASEYPCEEDFWAAGAEYADSCGADLISSSLGYSTFDDAGMNYSISDLDGNTAFVTRAADIAASKGIMVVNSAGNERSKPWKRIICPSDGDSVLAAGAVDGNNLIASFSSAGPSTDRRIKPDLSAMGVSIPVQTAATTVGRSNGTSFSCPVLSGMAASLMQAVPRARSADILRALQQSADKYNRPDSLYGYGIPDMSKALAILQELFVSVPEGEVSAGPNPTTGDIEVVFRTPPGSLTIEIFAMTGRSVFKQNYPEYAGRRIKIEVLQNMEQGIYFIRLSKTSGSEVLKIIRIKN
jgi:serine protease AprX